MVGLLPTHLAAGTLFLMGHTDVISKSLIQQIVKDLATYLLGLKLCKLEEAPTEQQRIEIRQADIVMHGEDMDGEQFLQEH